jgi:ankyrin repeat protein
MILDLVTQCSKATALIMSSSNGHVDVTEVLLGNGANIDFQDIDVSLNTTIYNHLIMLAG